MPGPASGLWPGAGKPGPLPVKRARLVSWPVAALLSWRRIREIPFRWGRQPINMRLARKYRDGYI